MEVKTDSTSMKSNFAIFADNLPLSVTLFESLEQFYIFCYGCIVDLNVMLVSDVQQSELDIYIYIYI